MFARLKLNKPIRPRKMVSFTNVSERNIDSFWKDMAKSLYSMISDDMDVSELVSRYDRECFKHSTRCPRTSFSLRWSIFARNPPGTLMLFTNRRSSNDNLSVVSVHRNLWLADWKLYLNQCCLVKKLIFHSKMSNLEMTESDHSRTRA